MKWGCKSSWQWPTHPSFPETFSALKVPSKPGLPKGRALQGREWWTEKIRSEQAWCVGERKGPRLAEWDKDFREGSWWSPQGAHRGLHTYFTYGDWLLETFFQIFFFLTWTIFKVFIKLHYRKLEMTEQLSMIKSVVIMFLFHVLGF